MEFENFKPEDLKDMTRDEIKEMVKAMFEKRGRYKKGGDEYESSFYNNITGKIMTINDIINDKGYKEGIEFVTDIMYESKDINPVKITVEEVEAVFQKLRNKESLTEDDKNILNIFANTHNIHSVSNIVDDPDYYSNISMGLVQASDIISEMTGKKVSLFDLFMGMQGVFCNALRESCKNHEVVIKEKSGNTIFDQSTKVFYKIMHSVDDFLKENENNKPLVLCGLIMSVLAIIDKNQDLNLKISGEIYGVDPEERHEENNDKENNSLKDLLRD